jgi:hypothetical protein
MTRAVLISLALSAAAASACVGDQSYTPIGEGQEDDLCLNFAREIVNAGSIAVETDEAGNASYSGAVDVTQFSRTSMTAETQELIISVPGGSSAGVEVEAGIWEYFNDMVFTIDLRNAGSDIWEPVELPATGYDVVWFTKVQVNGAQGDVAASSLALCSSDPIGSESLQVPYVDTSNDYEIRLRTLPFEGIGDAVGSYDYTVNVNIR